MNNAVSATHSLPLVVAVTGHRDLVDVEVEGIRSAIQQLFECLIRDYPDRELQLLTPLAEGADQLAAEVALELGCSVIALLPMSVAAYRNDFKGDERMAAFERLLNQCDEVIELEPVRVGRVAENGGSSNRDMHYAQLGVFMAAHCHVLLAVWDGKPSQHMGGTSNVVQFHHDQVMPGYTEAVFATREMLIDDESDLVYHVVCSRDRPNGEPAEGLNPLECWWFSKDAEQPRSKTLPDQHRAIFSRSNEFSRDCNRY
ncbi:MAG: hypothetical protein AAGH65_07960, partial [Pseudomonadota bacterium]